MMCSVRGVIQGNTKVLVEKPVLVLTLFTRNPHLDRLGIKHEPARRDTLDQVLTPWHGHHHCY